MMQKPIRKHVSTNTYDICFIFYWHSVHKDPYENIYCVVKGFKDFILHPPTDLPFIPYGDYHRAHYEESNNELVIVPDMKEETVPWISIDPLQPNLTLHPSYKAAHQVRCRVEAGEC